jgi:cytochrome c biogenesis protein CcdA
MDIINSLIDNYNLPLLTAFLLGILTSISPCPLATNITAVAFISKDIKTPKHTIISGLFYTLGRGISYTLLATLIYFGISSFSISSIFQGWGDKVLGPILIFISLLMFNVFKINIGSKNEKIEELKEWLSKKGYVGLLLLGAIFALAFCPYSGVMFFGVLVPLTVRSQEGLLLPILFSIGTGLPVIIFSFLIATSLKQVGNIYKITQKIEIVMRYIVASTFMMVGIYYSFLLIKFIFI